MGWESLKKLSSRKKKRSKASDIKINQDDADRKKSSGNVHSAETTSDEHSETSPSDRAKPDKKFSVKERGVPKNAVAVYTPRTPKTPQKKRNQKSGTSDTSSGSKSKEKVSIDKKKDKQAPSKKTVRPRTGHSSDGTNDASSRKQTKKKKQPKKSDNKSETKSDAKKAEPKADSDGKKGKKKSENVPVKKQKRSAERISFDANNDESTKKQTKRKNKWPKKSEKGKGAQAKLDDEKLATPQITPPKEVTVMGKPDDPIPISQFFNPQMKDMPLLVKPIKQDDPKPVVPVKQAKLEDQRPIKPDNPKPEHPLKEDDTDDDLDLSELRTCSLLKAPVPNKRHASPVHKNKKMQHN